MKRLRSLGPRWAGFGKKCRIAAVSGLWFLPLACQEPLELGSEDPESCSFQMSPRTGVDTNLRGATFWEGKDAAGAAVLRDRYQSLKSNPNETTYSLRWDTTPTRVSNLANFPRSPTGEGAFVSASSDVNYDLVQLNGGSDVLRWSVPSSNELAGVDLLHARTPLCPLESVLESSDGTSRLGVQFFGAALEPSVCQGKVFAAPVGMHRLNTLLFSRDALTVLLARLTEPNQGRDRDSLVRAVEALLAYDREGQTPFPAASDFQGFLAAVAALDQEADTPPPLLAIGTDALWPLSYFAFECLMASRPGHLFEDVWSAHLGADDRHDEMEAWISDFSSYFSGERPLVTASPTWSGAVEAVFLGEALVTPMGDFAISLRPEGTDKDAVIVVPFPGGDLKGPEPFVYTPDSLAVIRAENHNGYAHRMFLERVLGDQQTIVEFAAAKGAIPPIVGLTDEDLNQLPLAHQRQGYRTFAAMDLEQSQCEKAETCEAERTTCEQESGCGTLRTCALTHCASCTTSGECDELSDAELFDCGHAQGCEAEVRGCFEQAGCGDKYAQCLATHHCATRLSLGLSGLAPSPGEDVCFDPVFEYLGAIAGGPFWKTVSQLSRPRSSCVGSYSRPPLSDLDGPLDPAAVQARQVQALHARTELVGLLGRMGHHRFAASCQNASP
jgi:hypothetical protein